MKKYIYLVHEDRGTRITVTDSVMSGERYTHVASISDGNSTMLHLAVDRFVQGFVTACYRCGSRLLNHDEIIGGIKPCE
jgi:hypothetical protein